ncbi:MAG TPA: hypothetical protein VIU64_18700, partial [Polyangia bacterium]
RANARAPLIEPQAPSSAARLLPATAGGAGGRADDPLAAADPQVLDESLRVRCRERDCDVEARYRIRLRQAATLHLAFVLPSPTPVSVKVGSAASEVGVAAAPPESLRIEDGDQLEQHALERRKTPVYEARFRAPFAAGENTLAVTYRQPLGRSEHGHGYFSKGRFTDFFRYEVWPLSEWKHAPAFHVDAEVAIHRPAPSWWARLTSKARSVGCRGSQALARTALEQRGDDLLFSFHLADPLPARFWCEVGDEDLVPPP